MCRDFLISNEAILNEIDVDMNLYGKYDITGVRDDEPEPCPNVWDEKRQCWSHAWKEFLTDPEINYY